MKKIILLLIFILLLSSCSFTLPNLELDEDKKTEEKTIIEDTNDVTLEEKTPVESVKTPTQEKTPIEDVKTPTQEKNPVEDVTEEEKTPLPHQHSFGEYLSNSTHHWQECECGVETTASKHTGGVATETKKAECEVCGTEYGSLKPSVNVPTPVVTYTITFDNMGHGMELESLTELTHIPLELPTIDDELYEFNGWYYDEALTDEVVLGSRLTSNITLFAKWTEIIIDDPVEKFVITDPIFETRKLSDISEVTMDDFFNLGNRIDVKITVSQEELNKLQADYETGYKSDIYRLASHVVIKLKNFDQTFTWEFDNVGIRQKGNTSRKNIFSDDGGLNLNHYKLSFDETFDDPDRYDSNFINKYGNASYKDREFLGMSGLDFKWDKNEDHTHIREIYANYMYRASGIMVQHAGLSTLSLIQSDKGNRETSMGLCTVFEPATKTFIKRSLKSDVSYVNMADWTTEKLGEFGLESKSYGDLYKCIYGADLTNNSTYNGSIGVSNISGSYQPLYDRKTHKNDEYNDIVLKNAINAISSGNYDKISQYVDLEYLAISEAVGFIVGNPDSMRYNDNNFMVYMRRTDGKMVFIPIDNDRCFGIIKDWNPKDANMHLSMLDRGASNSDRTISLLLNTVLAKSSNPSQELYLEFLNKLKESSWCDENTFKTYYNMAKKSYSDYYFSSTDSSINVTFETYMRNKLNCITSSDSGNNNNNDNENDNVSINTDIYLVSSINNWGEYSSNDLNKYKFNKIGENTYQLKVSINTISNDDGRNYIKFKFNGGYNDYSKLDWTLSEDLKTLITSVGSSAKLYDVNVGDIVTITIDVKTKEASVSITKK